MSSIEEKLGEDKEDSIVLHVVVVGFHHKKGCLVEFAYPPLIPDLDGKECPDAWKHLPSLAMPDGSHNFVEDTVYFHLPSLTKAGKTVFGISSYRQIEADMLTKKTDDITRSTVQKSVCVLSTQPLYGQIQVKMKLITEAYFREGDFSQHSLLHDAYMNLNQCLNKDLLNSTQALIGVPLRSIASQFGHKLLILFKLILLEKKVLFFHSPVRQLSSLVLGILALFPGLVEQGLHNCTALLFENPNTPNSVEVDEKNHEIAHSESTTSLSSKIAPIKQKIVSYWMGGVATGTEAESAISSDLSRGASCEDLEVLGAQEAKETVKASSGRLSPSALAELSNEDCGFPMKIFADGYLCHPYLSLSYLDLLNDPKVRGYIVGATNVLFKQKRNLFEVTIEIDQIKIEVNDPELRRQLELTKEDMRFVDHINRHVTQEQFNTFLEGVGWEGGDDWLRAEFKSYLLYMLRSSLCQDSIQDSEFNPYFMQALRTTSHYSKWFNSPHPAVSDLQPGHSFSGQLSMSDVKLKLNHLTQTMQNTEKGRKISTAALNTSRAVVQTGKAVGGAISHAKGALSQWWSAFHNAEPEIGQEAHKVLNADETEQQVNGKQTD